ncbi:MAG: DMT family transporter [Cycloclasticus sp.]|jgi:transporter family-2 protein|nr:DMT family transporter [Cycloclasticus sp.]MEE4291919.1 DMT family transporter [Cycloclasticus sp.]
MNLLGQNVIYGLVMFIAGVGIPIMGALSGGLGARLQSPALAAVILFVVGFFIAVIYLLTVEGVPNLFPKVSIPIQYYLGGVFIIFYTLSITYIGPKFGIGNAVCFVLLGQLVSMSLIDHFSLLGSLQYSITLQRFSGLLFMAIGVFLVVKRF